MNYKIIHYEEANSRFNIKEIFLEFHSMYDEAERFFASVILFEGDTLLESLMESDYCKQGALIILNGNIEVQNSIKTYGDDYGLRAILVLGNVVAKNLEMGSTDICIRGNLVLADYLYTIRPPYESGILETKGEISVPFIVQQDYNPEIIGNRNSRSKYYGPDDLADCEDYVYDAKNFSIAHFIDFLKEQ
jgi:hypothetical protein